MGGFAMPYLGVTPERVQKMSGEITIEAKPVLGPEGRRHNMIINAVIIGLLAGSIFLFFKWRSTKAELHRVTSGGGMVSQ